MLKTCQYSNCLKDIGADGVLVSLKRATFDGEQRAGYCCAAHAAAALTRLAMDRDEPTDAMAIPATWRVT